MTSISYSKIWDANVQQTLIESQDKSSNGTEAGTEWRTSAGIQNVTIGICGPDLTGKAAW